MEDLDASPSRPDVRAPIGILIATYNRVANLMVCLRHLEAQTWKDFEVLVVVDGSTDSTVEQLERYQRTSSFPLRFLFQTNQGLSQTRNIGIRNLHAPICLLIGDDIFATPDFVRIHLEFHQQHPQLEAVAVGYTRWCERGQIVTPFMRWNGEDGCQFAYEGLRKGSSPSWKHFYSSNLSLKSAYLRKHPSYEGFKQYGLEDIELGYRLSVEAKLSMFFLPDAIADHLHPTTFRRSCDRAIQAGAAAHQFAQLWPEHRYLPPKSKLKRALLPMLTEPHIVLPTLKAAADLVTRVWCPNPLMKTALLLHERYGYQQAAAEAHSRARKMSAPPQD